MTEFVPLQAAAGVTTLKFELAIGLNTPTLSVAVNESVTIPTAVGLPEIKPVVDKVRPAGNLPLVKA